ncbi:leukotriene A-4 hydrolase isoform X3 [Dermacentor albipictus]|uniref:leukotriene A-4 hydrolase isoform X3 n=1 Tax=Dermacentor albipictus TaxID=60249 RepID=UPI0038FD3870
MANFGKTTNDPHSYARPDQCLVTHIHLEIEIDFRRKVIAGFVDITCEKRSDECSVLVLDTQDLIVKRVQQRQMSKELNFTLAEADPILGSKLEIQLGPDFARDNSAKICVEYETSSSSSALQWLTAQQTAGKLYPYLYSHCEPIHARSMLPCQDTPTVKMPYSALVRAPKELTVLMSAIRQGCDECGDGATRVTKFAQEVPVPSYLIAIAVGAIESRKIGPRCAVLAEKEQLNLAVIDFADTERMLCSAESLVGPYLWGVYDLLVLPPSFPYGGMENPCLTFATPSLLIETLGVDNPLTCLVPRLSGVHPDEAFSSVPYEKGHTFLYYLETLLGGPEVFDKFLLAYIEKYKYQSVDTWQWKAYLYDYFKDKADILNRVEWEAWLHSPGMPPVIPSYSRALVIPCEQLCAKWANPGTDSKSFSPEDISSLQPGQRSLFLSLLLKERPLSADQIQLLTKTYKMEEAGNAEIKFRWLRLGLRAKWDPVVPHVCQFLQTYGRMKFVCPLFRDLHSWEEKRQLTKKLFTELKPQMMHVVTLRLSKDLGLS